MQVGQFTDSFPPIINGVSAFVAEHHAELATLGHQPHVFTFGYRDARDAQPNVWRSPGLTFGSAPQRIGVALAAEARRAAARLDVAHTHESFMAGRAAAQVARRRGIPLIFTNHTRHDLYILNYPRVMQPFLRALTFGLIARFIRLSAVASAPSEQTADWMRQLAPDAAERVCVMRNGIRLDQFERVEPGARAELGIEDGATLFVYVGRLTPEKNLPAFARALAGAVAGGADAHWLVIGDGECRDELHAHFAATPARAHFLGAIPRERVPRYLAAADAFATPSLSEVNPVSVIEGLAAGKPYLGLRAAWWDEFRLDGDDAAQAGVLAGDEHELRLAVEALCGNRPRLREMGDLARQLSHRFDIRDITARWIEMYQSAIMGAASAARSAGDGY